MLTGHEINDVIERLRVWLIESNEELESADLEAIAEKLGQRSDLPQVGLIEIAEAFTALRHEIKLQTKDLRNLQGQIGDGLSRLGEATTALNTTTVEVEQQTRRDTLSMVESLLDMDEALAEAITTQQQPTDWPNSRHPLVNELQAEFDRLPAWRRMASKLWQDRVMQRKADYGRDLTANHSRY